MENKNQKIGLIIILSTVLFLAIIFIGMTYAFFTANNPEGSTAQIISETGRMVINYDDGTDIIQPVTGIVPSNAIIVNKTFSLTGSNTTVGMKPGDGLSMPYKVGVKYTSTFSDGMMHYYIKEVNRPANSQVTANYVIKPETGKSENDYKNQTVPGNDTYTGYTHGTFKNGKNYTEMVTGEFPASLNDQTITFNLIIQFPDNNENQDSEKGKTFNGKIVVNYESPKSFAEDTWETIAENTSSDVYNVGDTKEVAIDGFTNTEAGSNGLYTVRIANNSNYDCTLDSKTACGFVVEFVDIITTHNMNSAGTYNGTYYDFGVNLGGWPSSSMRDYIQNTLLGKLPSDLQSVIADTTVISGHGPADKGERIDGNWGTTDKLYLLSSGEIYSDCLTSNCFDTASYPYNGSGATTTRQLDYYDGVTTSANYEKTIKQQNGTSTRWWLRVAYAKEAWGFRIVHPDGINYDVYYGASYEGGVAPAFRIG